MCCDTITITVPTPLTPPWRILYVVKHLAFPPSSTRGKVTLDIQQ